jgi:hypothetical protein
MNWSARLPLVAVLCTLPLWSQAQALQATDTFSKDIEEALGYVNAGLPDRALVLLEDVAKRAEATGQKESAVEALIRAADYYRQQNRREPAFGALVRAGALAQGTPVEVPAGAFWRLPPSRARSTLGTLKPPRKGSQRSMPINSPSCGKSGATWWAPRIRARVWNPRPSPCGRTSRSGLPA